MKKLLLLICIAASLYSSGQTNFLSQGKITFERRVSQFNINKSEDGEENFWDEEMKKLMSKVVVDEFILEFTPEKSYFKMGKENSANKYMWGLDLLKPNDKNYVLQDYSLGNTIMIRNIFESNYYLSDSIKKFEWKITGEVREIAGFECKKALTKICDSVVVVAFYTDQITTPGGPENFNGLPGMILGLAIPRLASTWFATKVENISITIPQPVSKSKKVIWADINKEVAKATKSWGKNAASLQWMANL
ncbi:MAG: GLPGLI family protein [Chitinophagia bacterium]|jgi:GLPGLI family protein